MPPLLQPIDDRIAVSGQLQPDDMAAIAARGFRTVVNNRPDREAMFGQPRTAQLAAAAEAAGLAFVDLPFSGPNAHPDQVRALAELLERNDGRILAFCKSGMRSTLLWAAAAVARGEPLEVVLQKADGAGQPLAPLRDTVAALAAAVAAR